MSVGLPGKRGTWLSRATGVATALATAGGVATSAPAPAVVRPAHATAGRISTVAGGVGGPGRATSVTLVSSTGVAAAGGSLYLAGGALRQVNATGWLTTPAGTGHGSGPYRFGGPASRFNLGAWAVAVDAHGNLVATQDGSGAGIPSVIAVVARRSGTFYGQRMTRGDIYHVAGALRGGATGFGGPATQAALLGPRGISVDAHGNLVFSDDGAGVCLGSDCPSQGSRVDVVAEADGTFYGEPMTAGRLYSIAGAAATKVSGDGGPARDAGLGQDVGQVSVDQAGNVLLADAKANEVRVIAAASGTFYGVAMAAGDIYRVAGDGSRGFAGDGGLATGAELGQPWGVALDGAGNVVVSDTGNNRVRVVAEHTGSYYGVPMTAGDIYTVAGDGGSTNTVPGRPATRSSVATPLGVTVDDAGDIVVTDKAFGTVDVVAAKDGRCYGQQMTAGDIYIGAGAAQVSTAPPLSSGPATRAELFLPNTVAADSDGDIAIDDQDAGDVVQLVAGKDQTLFGRRLRAAQLYRVAGDGSPGFSGDGGPATSARLDFPSDTAFDRAGDLVIADANNCRLRVVAAQDGTFYGRAMSAGDIYTIAGDGTCGYAGDGGPALTAELSAAAGVTVDPAGNLLVADARDRVRVVAEATGRFYGVTMTAGDIYTVAGDGTQGFAGDGGPATDAELSIEAGVTVDGAGNLVVADTGNCRVRVVASATGSYYGVPMTAGDIYTVAGVGPNTRNDLCGYAGNGGPARLAGFWPQQVAVDPAGNIVVADMQNSRVWVVATATGTFYRVPMTAGDAYVVAGDGRVGFAGDGGAATAAELANPGSVATGPGGSLLIADTSNFRIRMVTGAAPGRHSGNR